MIARSPVPVLKRMGNEQEQQILRASLSVETYRHKEQEVQHFLVRLIRKRSYLVMFLNADQYFYTVLKKTARRPSNIWTMNNPSAFESLIFLHCVSLILIRMCTQRLDRSSTFVMRTMLGYTVQKTRTTRTSLAHAAGTRPFL